jgi:hypothetical protein
MPYTEPFAERALIASGFPFRSDQAERLVAAMARGEHVIVVGDRVSSRLAIELAIPRSRRSVLRVELAGMSLPGDVTTRLLQAAARELPSRWGTALSALAKGFAERISLDVDARTGHVIPTLVPTFRQASSASEQLTRALDVIGELARADDAGICVVLEDVNELPRVASGAEVEGIGRALAAATAIGFVLVTGNGIPFPLGLDRVEILPADEAGVADWIDSVLRGHGVKPQETGAAILRLCGSSIGAVLQLARECLHGVRENGFARDEDVNLAFERLVAHSSTATHTLWHTLTAHQQNVLRAVAAKATGLTTIASRQRFCLGDTGTAHNSAQLLLRKGVLDRHGRGYVFTDPFVRGWVIANALPDAGLFLPITHIPTEREP